VAVGLPLRTRSALWGAYHRLQKDGVVVSQPNAATSMSVAQSATTGFERKIQVEVRCIATSPEVSDPILLRLVTSRLYETPVAPPPGQGSSAAK
jgi:hypothetical protein